MISNDQAIIEALEERFIEIQAKRKKLQADEDELKEALKEAYEEGAKPVHLVYSKAKRKGSVNTKAIMKVLNMDQEIFDLKFRNKDVEYSVIKIKKD